MPLATAKQLLDALLRFKLLEPIQVDELAGDSKLARLPSRDLAAELIRRGWLTPFQVNQLLQDRGHELLLGSYVLLERLGEGGMGAVYTARNWKLGQIVAVKVIRKERLTNPNAVRRFQREIRAAAQLNHPNIVRALDADDVRGTHLLVMEHVAGGVDLHRLVKERGPLPVGEACRLIRQAASGLQHAHERGLVHRDIKPHNLLLSLVPGHSSSAKIGATGEEQVTNDKGVLKILDMGLARLGQSDEDGASSTLTQEGTVMGTLDYIAPEQATDSHDVDIRADLYSLGCTFYYLLTGRVPFPGGDALKKLIRHREQQPAPVAAFRTDVPDRVAAIVARLMAKRPEDRYQTPAELAEALDAVLSGGVTAHGSAVTATLPSGEITANVFADALQSSDTAALFPELVKRPVLPAADRSGSRGLRIGLLAMAGLAALVLVGVLVRSFVGESQPPAPPGATAAVQQPEQKKPKNLIELAAEEARKEAEAQAQERRKRREEAKKRLAQEPKLQARRAAEAEAAFPALGAKFQEKSATFASFARDVAAFKAKHGGTPAAVRAAELLMRLPSPLDQLDPKKLPQDARAEWKVIGFDGKDVVAVLGQRPRRHWGTVESVAFSPDGKTVASASADGVVYLRDAETLLERAVLRVSSHLRPRLAFSTDGRVITASNDGHIIFSDGRAGEEVQRWKGTFGQLAFSPDGARIATSHFDHNVVVVWNAKTGQELRRFDLPGHQANAIAFGADGRLVLSGGHEGTIRWLDVDQGMEVRRFTHPEAGTSNAHFWDLAVFGDGRRAVSGSNDGIRMWNIETGAEIRRFETDGPAFAIAILPRSGHVLAGHHNGIRLWDGESGKELHRFVGASGAAKAVACSPDGRRAVSGGDNGAVHLWDVATGNEVQPLTGPVGRATCLAFAPDDSGIVTGHQSGGVFGWEARRGWQGQQLSQFPDGVPTTCVAYSPDGSLIACGALGPREIRLLGSGKRSQRVLADLAGGLVGAAFSADGAMIGLVMGDAGVEVREVGTGDRHAHLPVDNALSGAFSPSSALMAIMDNTSGTLQLWDAVGGLKLWTAAGRQDPSNPVKPVFSPDGMTIATGGYSGHVKLWTAADGAEKLSVPEAAGGSVAFSPDGSLLATAAPDGRVGMLRSATGARLCQWRLPGPVHAVAFANDGRHLATANGNGTVYILRLPKESLAEVAGADGFVPLFNGKDLTGWKAHDDKPPQWKIVDGILTGTGAISDLSTLRSFRDFHLRVEVKVDSGDSGISFRGKTLAFGAAWYHADLMPGSDHGMAKWQNDRFTQNWKSSRVLPAREWVLYELIAQGGRFRIKHNGQQVADVADPAPILERGPIMLQCYAANTTVHFRRVEIKEL